MAQKQRITSARRAAAPVGADPHDPVEAKALVSAHPDTMRYVPSSYERVAPEMGRRKCQIHFVVTASGRAPAPRCFAAQWADCCFSRSVFPFSKVLNKCRAQGLPDRKAGNSSARHILAGAIAPAAETRFPLGRGNAGRVSWSRPERSSPGCPVSLAGAIAPATVLRRYQDQPGAKAPGQRPTRPRRALRPRRVGRWPIVVPGPTDLQGTVPLGRGNAGRVSWSRPERSSPGCPVSLAGAIAPATTPR